LRPTADFQYYCHADGWEASDKRINAMMDITMKNEEKTLAFEVSDEALEIAAGTGKANFTLGACTGLSECPG
jgi:hypothetical protein